MDKVFSVHLCQWEVVPGDVDGNLEKVESLFRKTDPKAGDLILLPEMFPSGFTYGSLGGISEKSGAIIELLSGRARHWGVRIAGSLPMRLGDGIANSMVLINPKGEITARYDKVHLFPLTGEDRYFNPGDKVVVVRSGDATIGLAVCFDLRFPELCRRLCLEGAQIVLVCAQWPMSRIDHFRDLIVVRAMENQLFIAVCNSCGKDGSDMSLGGSSMVAGPSGAIKGSLGIEEDVLSVTVDLEENSRVREEFPVLRCRREDIYGKWWRKGSSNV